MAGTNEFLALWNSRSHNYNYAVGIVEYNVIELKIQWHQKCQSICDCFWLYIPRKGKDIIEFTPWNKGSLAKVIVDCEGGTYKYHSYYGTKLLSKSTCLLHAIKELIKYK